MNKVSLILFLIAGFFFLLQCLKGAMVLMLLRSGAKGGRHSVNLIAGWIALTCAIVGVVLK